jgi:hypothetical protein
MPCEQVVVSSSGHELFTHIACKSLNLSQLILDQFRVAKRSPNFIVACLVFLCIISPSKLST